MPDYAAFISYSHNCKEWVLQLQKNLELCLEHHGAKPSKVFLDQIDLLPGNSWVGCLDDGLAKAERLILVITPEAMSSPRVEEEWKAWIGRHRNWQRDSLVVPVELIASSETPMTLDHIQRADFTVSTHEAYCNALQKVLGVMLGRADARDLPDLPSSVVAPEMSSEQPRSPIHDDLLARYLEMVKSEHSHLLPFMEGLEDELLDKVYVQLTLSTKEHISGKIPRQLADRDNGIELGKLLQLEAPWITGRWTILGDPGAGKTTLLRHFVQKLAVAQDPHWIPVFEPLSRLAEEREHVFERIAEKMEKAEGRSARELSSALKERANKGRLLLVLDGLDEVPPKKNKEIRKIIEAFSRKWKDTPIIVSTRPIGFKPLPEFREVHVLPLSREKKKLFLTRWFGRKNGTLEEQLATEFLDILEAVPTLSELASIPLYLTLMALLREQDELPDRNLSVLYRQVLDLLLKGQYHDPPTPIKYIIGARRALQHLAFQMTKNNVLAESFEQLEARLYRRRAKAVRKDLESVTQWKGKMRRFLEDESETGILAQHDGPGTKWRFWHRTFREALTAEDLARILNEQGTESILKLARKIKGKEGQWAEPFALLTGQIADRDKVAVTLIKENQALGLRALATARNVKNETIMQALKLGENPEQRSKIYLEVPRLVDDPERSLQLLTRLSTATRNGYDLFFIDLAIQGIGQRWPNFDEFSEMQRHRIYDHIPEPPKKLFQWIDTPHDGRVPLWCEIPAGSFLMGGGDDDEALDWEKTRHHVTVLSPYQMAAVPVTQEQFTAFDPDHASSLKGALRPVDRVTWYQAVSFCRWLATFPWAAGARLPSEEEWEYACRAGTKTRFWSGEKEEDLERVGWYIRNEGHRTHSIGEKPPNPWGLYDVHGNVWEWTATAWDAERYRNRLPEKPYSVDPATSAVDLAASPRIRRVMRGGSCWDTAQGCRSAYRLFRDPEVVIRNRGFRVLLSSVPSRPSGNNRTECLSNDQDSGNRSSTRS